MNRTQNRPPTPPISQEYGQAAADRYLANVRLARVRWVTARAEWTRHIRGCPACNSWQASESPEPMCHQGQLLIGRRRRLVTEGQQWARMAETAAHPPSTLF